MITINIQDILNSISTLTQKWVMLYLLIQMFYLLSKSIMSVYFSCKVVAMTHNHTEKYKGSWECSVLCISFVLKGLNVK